MLSSTSPGLIVRATFLEGVEHASSSRRVLVLLIAGIVVGLGRRVLKRTTGGHGAELSEAIWFHSGRLPLVRTLASSILSITAVGMGASIGREGALKQAGAVVASRLCVWLRLSPSQRRLLVACGAGAGMAAAYNVPFGGALFALEVMLGTLELPLVLPAVACSLIATGISWAWLPQVPKYSIPSYGLWLRQIAWAGLFGLVAGLAAVVYIQAISRADAQAQITPHHPRADHPADCPGGAGDFVSPTTGQRQGPGATDLRQSGRHRVAGRPVAAQAVGHGGGLAGWAWDRLWPGVPPANYAIIGSAAVLAAATQGPISSIVLMIELTRRVDAMMVPMMLAIAGASLVTRRLSDKSVYSARVRLRAVLETTSEPQRIDGRDIHPAPVTSAAARYPQVLRELLNLKEGNPSLYVLDERGRLVGAIRVGSFTMPQPPMETVTAADLAKPVQPLPRTTMPGDLAAARLAAGEAVPVIDAGSGRYLGVVD